MMRDDYCWGDLRDPNTQDDGGRRSYAHRQPTREYMHDIFTNPMTWTTLKFTHWDMPNRMWPRWNTE